MEQIKLVLLVSCTFGWLRSVSIVAAAHGTTIAYLRRHSERSSTGDLYAYPVITSMQKYILQANISIGQQRQTIASCSGPEGFICWIGRMDPGFHIEIHCYNQRTNVTRYVLPRRVPTNNGTFVSTSYLQIDPFCENVYWRDPVSGDIYGTSLRSNVTSSSVIVPGGQAWPGNRRRLSRQERLPFFYLNVEQQYYLDWIHYFGQGRPDMPWRRDPLKKLYVDTLGHYNFTGELKGVLYSPSSSGLFNDEVLTTVDNNLELLIYTYIPADLETTHIVVKPFSLKFSRSFEEKTYSWRNISSTIYFEHDIYWRLLDGTVRVMDAKRFYGFQGFYNRMTWLSPLMYRLEGSIPRDFTVLYRKRRIASALVNPCAGRCSHFCLQLGYGRSRCSCPRGYFLSLDGKTCKPFILLAHMVRPSGTPVFLLLDSIQYKRGFCEVEPTVETVDDNHHRACSKPLEIRARGFCHNLTDLNSPGHRKFSNRLLDGILLTSDGYLYRHEDNHRCVYWMSASTGQEAPFYCSPERTEIIHFTLKWSADFPAIVTILKKQSIQTNEFFYTIEAVRLHDNAHLFEKEMSVFNGTCVGVSMETICYIEGNHLRVSDLKRLEYYTIEMSRDFMDFSSNICGSGLREYRTAFFDNEMYMSSTNGILVHKFWEGTTHILWQEKDVENSKNSSHIYQVGFAVLQEFPKAELLMGKRNACPMCTQSCFLLNDQRDCLCPSMVGSKYPERCNGEPTYYTVYDETLQLPLFGRDKLSPMNRLDQVGSLSSSEKELRVSKIAARNVNNTLCWVYEGEGAVKCRNLLDENKTVENVVEIHANSTILMFSLSGNDLFYNDGNCGHLTLYSFKLGETFEFSPWELDCNLNGWALDTERKIFFWSSSVEEKSIHCRVLHTGHTVSTIYNQVSDYFISMSLDVQRQILYLVRLHKESMLASGCSFSFANISQQPEMPMHDVYIHVPRKRANKLIYGLQFYEEKLFWLTTGKSLPSQAQVDPTHEISVLDLNTEKVVQVYLQTLVEPYDESYRSEGKTFANRSDALIRRSGSMNDNDKSSDNANTAEITRLFFLSGRYGGIQDDPCPNSSCSHFCFPQDTWATNPSSRYLCRCPDNLLLMNGTTCIPLAGKDDLDGRNNNSGWISPLAFSLVTVSMVTMIVMGLLVRNRRRTTELRRIVDDICQGNQEALHAANTDAEKAQNLPLTCIIPPDELFIDDDKILGEGNFGRVVEGTYLGAAVAVKKLKSASSFTHLLDLGKEVKIMNYIGDHPHVVKLFGAEISQIKRGKFHVVIEFSPFGSLLRNLRSFDRKTRIEMDSDTGRAKNECFVYDNELEEACLNDKDYRFLSWAEQIASGMHHLATKNVYHGDLAARNVLVFERDVLKISDFGLSRRLYNYSKYVKKSKTPLPWQWMAYESLKRMEFSIKSDIWAYGVTLWEIFSLGDHPFASEAWNQDFLNKLQKGIMLERPAHAPTHVYEEVMKPCWNLDPEQRPDFANILSRISEFKRKLAIGREEMRTQ